MKSSINELSIFFTAMIYLIPLLISNSWEINLLLLGLALINLIFQRKINIKLVGYFILIMLLPLSSLFITVLLYTKEASNTVIIGNIIGFPIYKLAMDNAIYLTTRAFSMSMISFIFLVSIRYDALVFSLMQILKLSPSIGYSLLATFNAFHYMEDEFIRIRSAWKNRFCKNKFPLSLIFPVLVSASRYAYHAGLSLECRGLNKKKSYLEIYMWTFKDTLFIILNMIEIIIINLIISGHLFTNIRLK